MKLLDSILLFKGGFMEIEYVREFVVLAEIGNFLEAAEQLFISQSSLSRHLKKLETDLGAPLFDRTTRKVTLNQYGKLFLPYAKEMTKLHYQFTAAFYNQLNGAHGYVKVGSIPVMTSYGITNFISRFLQENPNFTLDVIEADSKDLIKMLRSNQCDFAFIRDWYDAESEFNKLTFTTDSLAALVPITHPLAKCDTIQIEQLAGEPLLLLTKDSFMYNLCVNECKKAGFDPRIIFTTRRAENLVDLVSKGMGITLLMKKPIKHLLNENFTIIDVEPRIQTAISFAYPKNTQMTTSAMHFLNLLTTI